jgi:hypothetical protein
VPIRYQMETFMSARIIQYNDEAPQDDEKRSYF